MQPFGRNRYGPKIGGSAPLWERGGVSQSHTMWPGPRPTCVPSFILIRPTVWPQCTNVTDRTDRQDRQDRQRSGSIGQTVLQTVAQKQKGIFKNRTGASEFNKCSAVAEMGDCLATIDTGRKERGCCAPLGGGAGFPSNTMLPGPRRTLVLSGILIHPAVWPQQTWAKIGELCSFWGGELVPHLTQCGQDRSLPPCQVSS